MLKRVFKILVAAVLAAAALAMVLVTVHTYTIIDGMVSVRVEPERNWPDEVEEAVEALELGTENDIELHAWHLAADDPEGVVILLHGMHGVDASSMIPFGLPLWEAGYEVFALDMRAHGESGGSEIGLGYTEVEDVTALLDWISAQEEYVGLHTTLVGYSMGGAAAINTAAIRPDVRNVISISSYASYEETFADVLRAEQIPEPIVWMYRAAVRFELRRRYGVSPTDYSPVNRVVHLDGAHLLLIHGAEDEQIGVRQGKMLHKAAEDSTLWVLPGEGHGVIQTVFADSDHRQGIFEFLQELSQ